MQAKNLSQVLRPIDHQKMINWLSKQYLSIEVLNKIQWHAEQYLAKTGQLPE